MSTITFNQLTQLEEIKAEFFPTAFFIGDRVRNGFELYLEIHQAAFRIQFVCSNKHMGNTFIPARLAIPFKECGLDLFEGKLTAYMDELATNLIALGEKLKQESPYWLVDFDWIVNEED